jgi:hypothetical protein
MQSRSALTGGDGGATWTKVLVPLKSFAIDPASPMNVFVGKLGRRVPDDKWVPPGRVP